MFDEDLEAFDENASGDLWALVWNTENSLDRRGGNYVVTRTFTATDDAGNSTSWLCCAGHHGT